MMGMWITRATIGISIWAIASWLTLDVGFGLFTMCGYLALSLGLEAYILMGEKEYEK